MIYLKLLTLFTGLAMVTLGVASAIFITTGALIWGYTDHLLFAIPSMSHVVAASGASVVMTLLGVAMVRWA